MIFQIKLVYWYDAFFSHFVEMSFLSYRLTVNLVVEKKPLWMHQLLLQHVKKDNYLYLSAWKYKGGKVSQDKYGYI